MSKNSSYLTEFIFGDLSKPAGRLQRIKTSHLGLFHSPILNPLVPQENESIVITVNVGVDISIRSITLHYTTDRTNPLSDNPNLKSIPFQRQEIVWNTLEWSYLETWTATIPAQAKGTLVQYVILAETTTGKTIYCPYLDVESIGYLYNLEELDQKVLKRFLQEKSPQIYSFYVENQPIPNWFREAVIYEVFVDRFAPNPEQILDLSERHGGTIQGIISQLDYLTNLGINCLWITPIFASSSYHGYDPKDHQLIDPRFGTEEDIKTLIAEAHQRDIKVICDFVANHFSNEHFAFQSAYQDKNSPYYTWFRFTNWPKKYDCFFDVLSQPEINSDHPGVRDYLIKGAQYWLKLGCDGFRLDYANGCTHAFWSAFHHAIRQVKSDSIILGEVVETPSVIRSFSGRMTGCLDFKLLELLRGFLAFRNLKVSQFDKVLQQHLSYFGSDLVLPSFLDNHDMNRFLWVVEGDKRRLKLAALCQFTLPHPPIIYYGTEIGLSQRKTVGRLEESRLPMVWDEKQDLELLEFYQGLIEFRRQDPSIWRLERETFLIDDDRGIYGYRLGSYQVILNNSAHENSLSLSPKKLRVVTDNNIRQTSENQLSFPPFSGVILQGNNYYETES